MRHPASGARYPNPAGRRSRHLFGDVDAVPYRLANVRGCDSVVGVVAAYDGNRGVRVTDQRIDSGPEAQTEESAVAA